MHKCVNVECVNVYKCTFNTARKKANAATKTTLHEAHHLLAVLFVPRLLGGF